MEEERHLGMKNTMKSSSIVMLSYHLYSSAYELEYSCLVIIMIYELAYSLCIMILTCSTSCGDSGEHPRCGIGGGGPSEDEA